MSSGATSLCGVEAAISLLSSHKLLLTVTAVRIFVKQRELSCDGSSLSVTASAPCAHNDVQKTLPLAPNRLHLSLNLGDGELVLTNPNLAQLKTLGTLQDRGAAAAGPLRLFVGLAGGPREVSWGSDWRRCLQRGT